MKNSLAKRSIESIGWNTLANTVIVLVSLVRSILLARWLPVEVFGIYAGAGALIALTLVLTNFGTDAAYILRAPETEDENKAARVLFTLKLIFTSLWIVIMIAAAVFLTSGVQQTTIIVLAITNGISGPLGVASVILMRRVAHRRLAVIQLLDVFLRTGAALVLAWSGRGIWALLATDIASLLVYVVGIYGWRPVWKPRLAWDPSLVRYYLRFGSRNFVASALVPALDKLDDLWTAVFLGKQATGYYSRAYTFATYPRLVAAAPLNLVTGGTFAELVFDRLGLSRAFFRSCAFLIRTGFIIAATLALIAPELIFLALGEQWLPMLMTFRLMLVFALLDPLKQNVANLFLAVGKPMIIVRVRLVQLAILLFGLFTLGISLGIEGVALSVDIMAVVGMGAFFYFARRYADFSLITLFAAPLAGLAAGILAANGLLALVSPASYWVAAALKVASFATAYVGIIYVFEGARSWEMIKAVWRSQRRD